MPLNLNDNEKIVRGKQLLILIVVSRLKIFIGNLMKLVVY